MTDESEYLRRVIEIAVEEWEREREELERRGRNTSPRRAGERVANDVLDRLRRDGVQVVRAGVGWGDDDD